jgi:general secretion pathway protein D
MTIRRCLHKFRTHCLVVAVVPLLAAEVLAGGPTFAPGSLAQSEILRRQQRVSSANIAYENGVRAGKDGDFETAYDELSIALDTLPYAEQTEVHRQVYSEAYVNYATRHAANVGEAGGADEAREIVESVLAVDTENESAAKLLERLDAGEFANIPAHAENSKRVSLLLKEGRSSYELAKYDEAKVKFHDVLRVDRYNTAAQRGLERVAHAKSKYHEQAYRQSRAEFIRMVDQSWELPVPLANAQAGSSAGGPTDDGGLGYITAKLDGIIIPSLRMNGFSLQSAMDYLRQRSIELDNIEGNPARKGINILIDERKINESSPGVLDAQSITLDLQTVPFAEALRYVTGLAGVKYRMEPHAVVIVPLTDRSEALFTRRYQVPPFFQTIDAGEDDGGGGAAPDPFADAGDSDSGLSLTRKKGAKEILEAKGISFVDGATAFYISAASELVVRNTQAQLDVVDQFVQNLIDQGVPKQIKVEAKFVEIQQDNLKELGFDWMIGGFGLGGGDRIMAGGGSVGGSERAFDGAQFPFFGRQDAIPASNPLNPVTAGLRSGAAAISEGAIETLVSAGRVGAASEIVNPAPGAFALAGVLTDPQFQVVLRALDQKKGTDLLSAPSILTRSGSQAQVEVIRELIFPTEYDPPELPQDFGDLSDLAGDGLIDPLAPIEPTAPPSFPVTPATPTAFETRNTGVTLKVTPQVGPDGYTIDLDLAPEVVEFEGFVNYGSPITTSGTDILGNTTRIVLTANRIEMPVFSTRRVTTNVTVYDGSTVAIGGLIKEDVQHTEDKLPIFGDLPLIGRLFRIEAEQRKKRNLMVFVTARLIDPSGQPLNRDEEDYEEDDIDSSLFPPVDPIAPRSYGKDSYGK